jgi:DNA-directed RNA polymerase subunit L
MISAMYNFQEDLPSKQEFHTFSNFLQKTLNQCESSKHAQYIAISSHTMAHILQIYDE